jgi:predicted DNA-binding transcriptional regulator AlpA
LQELKPFPTAAEADSAAGARPEPLLINMGELARLTSLSVRTLRRMDACRDIPGRVEAGRRVLFQTEVICEWVRAGLPDRERWSALQKGARR